MLTLNLTLRGHAIGPTEHADLTDMGDALAAAFDEADMGLKPQVLTLLLSLMCHDLYARQTWAWVAEDYEIYVARSGA